MNFNSTLHRKPEFYFIERTAIKIEEDPTSAIRSKDEILLLI